MNVCSFAELLLLCIRSFLGTLPTSATWDLLMGHRGGNKHTEHEQFHGGVWKRCIAKS